MIDLKLFFSTSHNQYSNVLVITGASDESTTLRSGRRLDDSIYESNDRNNFEGSLMRLTAKPIETSSTLSTTDRPLDDVNNFITTNIFILLE